MASRYWVGGSDTWDATIATKWSATSGGAGGASIPTGTDNVFFDAASGVNTITVTASISCATLDFTGFTGTFNSGASTAITVNIFGALTCSSTMTTAGSGTYQFQSTNTNGGAGWGITTAGKTLSAVSFLGVGGKWVQTDALTSAGTLTLSAGTYDTGSFAVTVASFVVNGTSTKVLSLNSSSVTVTANATAWSSSSVGLTQSANTAVVTMTGNSSTTTFVTSVANQNGLSLAFTGAGTSFVNGTTTFANLTRNGTAVKTDVLTFAFGTSVTVTGTFAANGNSLTNRVLVSTTSAGVPVSVTAAAVSLSNVDFMDIVGAGAASPFTGTSLGDAQGNSNITFPASVSRYAVVAGNWSSTATWSATSGGAGGASVPLPQDDVFLNASSAAGSYVVDMPRLCRNFDCTGFARTWTQISIGTTIYGSVTLSATATYSQNQQMVLAGRGSQTFTSNGKTIGGTVFTLSAPGGTYTQADAVTWGTSSSIAAGTWVTNNFSVNIGGGTGAGGVAGSAVLNAGTSTITINSVNGNWSYTSSAASSMASCTFFMFAATTSARTFAGGGKTYGTITYTVANSPGSLIISGANTIGTLNVAAGRTLLLPSSTTTAITNWNVAGQNNGYQLFPAAASAYASVPNAAAVQVTGDIDLRVRVAADNWAAGAGGPFYLLTKDSTLSGGRSWALELLSTGTLQFDVNTDGSASLAGSVVSSVSVTTAGAVNGSPLWLRVTRRQSDGRVQFFTASGALTAPIATDFTQLGVDRTIAATLAITAGTQEIDINGRAAGSSGTGVAGKYYRAQIRNGLDGTLVMDADFTTKAWGVDTFTESSANAATVTIAGAGTFGDGRMIIAASSAGTAATLSKSTNYIASDYAQVKDITFTGGGTFYAGSRSTSVSNNTGVTFTDAPQRYWVGGTATWDATVGTKWAVVSGGTGGLTVPTASIDVFFDANSVAGVATIPASTTVLARSLTCTGYVGTLAFAATTSVLTIGDASGGAMTLSSGMTLLLTAVGTINFVSTSSNGGAGWGITTAGKTMPNTTFNGLGGKWALGDAFNCTGTLTVTAGTWVTNNFSVSAVSFNSNGGAVRSSVLGTSTLTFSSASTPWVAQSTNNTFSGTSSTIIGTGNWAGGGLSYGTIQFSIVNSVRTMDAFTCVNLQLTNTAITVAALNFTGDVTITGTLTVTGNSLINRILLQSATAGTARTLTAAATSLSNVDFTDITGAGAAAPFTGTSLGDALGNTNITFPTGVTRYAVVAGNWSSTSMWATTSGGAGGASVPLPQDDVYMDANSAAGTYTADMPRMGRNLDCTGFTRTLTGSLTTTNFYGSLTFSSAMTYTLTVLQALGRGSHTITSASKVPSQLIISSVGGTYTLLDALTVSNIFQTVTGTFVSGNFTMTIPNFNVWNNTGAAGLPTVNLGTSNIVAFNWQVLTTTATVLATSATFTYAASSTARTFAGGSQTYGTVTYTVANSPGALVITGANSFVNLNVGPGRSLTLPSNAATTVTNWNVSGQNRGYVYTTGDANCTVPRITAYDITGDVDIRAKVFADIWSPTGYRAILSNFNTNVGYDFGITNGTNGLLSYTYGTGSGSVSLSSSTGLSYVDGSVHWVRVTQTMNNGASGNDVKFWTSPDGTTWTQLGTTRTTAGTTKAVSTNALVFGGRPGGVFVFAGGFYQVQIRNNILDDGTGIVLDANFATKAFGVSTFTESSTNAATVTLGSTTNPVWLVGDGRVALAASTSGTPAVLITAQPNTGNVVVSDTFTRANSATTLGSPETGPNPWVATLGTWGINSNQAYNINATSGYVVTDTGKSDFDVSVTASVVSGSGGFLLARYVDTSNHWLIGNSSGNFFFQRVLAGTTTSLFIVGRAYVSGDVYRVVMTNKVILVFLNGSLVYATVDASHVTATKVGMTTANNGFRFDNFTSRDLPVTTSNASSYLTVKDIGVVGTWYAGTTSVDSGNNTNWLFTNPTISAAIDLRSTSTLGADGAISYAGAATLVSTSTLTVDGTDVEVAAATLSSASTLLAGASVAVTPTATLASASTLAVSPSLAVSGAAVLASTSTMPAVGSLTEVAASLLASSSVLTATATITRFSPATLLSTSTLLAGGLATEQATSTLSSASTLFVAGQLARPGVVVLQSSTVLTATASVQVQVVLALTSTSSLSADGVRATTGQGTLLSTSLLVIGAQPVQISGNPALTAVSTLLLAGVVVRASSVDLSSASTLLASGISFRAGYANLLSTSTLIGTATYLFYISSITLQGYWDAKQIESGYEVALDDAWKMSLC